MSAIPPTAIIVAAGKSSRLPHPDGVPKPLRPIAGVPLVARIMHAAAEAGLRHFVVVIGWEADRMRRQLPALVPPGSGLTLVDNDRFDEPNGISLRLGAERVGGPLVLLMADHLFSPDRLARARHRGAANLLVVERRESFTGDLDDATRVLVRDGKVAAIGKGLAEYDAIDTGMFVLDAPAIVRALDRAGPGPSISDGMRALAADGALAAFDPGAGWWIDVDTPSDVAAAERALYRSLRKPTDGLLARLVNRRVSLCVSTRIWRLGVTPNMMTAATLLLGLAAGFAFAQGAGPGWGLLGAALFQLQSVLDGADGELARLLLKESRFGHWLDLAADNLTHMAVFAGIAAGQAAGAVPGPWAALGTAAVLGVGASFAALAPLLPSPRSGGASRHPGGALGRLVDGLSRRDFTYLLFPLAALGWLGWFLWAAAIGTWVYALAVVGLRLRNRRAEV
ncbi:MAG: NTP transferase domain-containing protein [Myxococcota bacterium]